MKRLITVGAVACTMLISGMAFAQDEVKQEADRVEYKRKTVIDFSDVTIQGELTKPEGSYILQRRNTSFRTLLKIRGNFLPELFNSTDNL